MAVGKLHKSLLADRFFCVDEASKLYLVDFYCCIGGPTSYQIRFVWSKNEACLVSAQDLFWWAMLTLCKSLAFTMRIWYQSALH